MKPFLWLTFLLLLSSPAFAACTGSSPNWDCPATGTADQNGTDLWNLLNGSSVLCGDTITIHPGQYNVLLSGGNYFGLRLKAQASCGSNKTQIVASNLSSFPAGTRTTIANCASMPQIIATGTPIGDAGLWITFVGAANNWAIRGVCFTTASTLAASTGGYAGGVGMSTQVGATTTLADLLNTIEFDRTVWTTYEETTYGSMATCVVQACFFRGVNITFSFGGQNINVHDSYIQTSQFDPRTPTTCSITAGTNASPAVLTCTGIASTFGIVNASGCTNGPTSDCWTGAGTRMAVFEGATGNWSDLNGPKFVVYQSADTVRVYLGDAYAFTDPKPYDSTSKGSLTGTISVRRMIPIEPSYVVSLASACVNCRFVNNAFEYGQMTFFTGGGVWEPTDNSATVQSGSTAMSLNLSQVTNLSIGDLVSFPVIAPSSTVSVTNGSTSVVGTGTNFNSSMAGQHAHIYDSGNGSYRDAGTVASVTDATHMTLTSAWSFTTGGAQPWTIQPTYCPSSAKGCYNSPIRIGKVTNISGATVTIVGWGPDASDLTPFATGTARWNGYQVNSMEFRHNTVLRHDEFPQSGKGYIELKNCVKCLLDGNILTNSASGNWFLTARTQGGNDPWNRGDSLWFTNNLVGGANGSPARMTLQGEDDEHSSSPSSNVFFQNNILPEVRYPNSATASPFSTYAAADGGGGFTNGGWKHNTALAKTSSSTHKAFGSGGCLSPPDMPSNYLFSTSLYFQDNLVSYGEGLDNPAACLTNAFNAARNLYLADGSVNAATIISTWTGNNASDSVIGLGMIGTCTYANYTNCGVANNTTYAGTASDGGNPGADVLQVKDRINAYSETAGLLVVDMTLPAMVNNPAAFSRNSTTTSMTFTIQGTVAGNCSLKLYTDINRATLAADTNTSGKQACNRSGNTINGKTVTFALGSQNALTPNTSYYYDIEVTDSGETMVGTFATLATGGTTRTGKVVVSGSAVIR